MLKAMVGWLYLEKPWEHKTSIMTEKLKTKANREGTNPLQQNLHQDQH